MHEALENTNNIVCFSTVCLKPEEGAARVLLWPIFYSPAQHLLYGAPK